MLLDPGPARNRIRRFLHKRKTDTPELESFLEELVGNGHVYLFGGVIRDFALRGRRGFASDLDFVFEGTSLESLVARTGKSFVRNRFGGFRLHFGEQPVDVWEVHRTWAFAQNIVQPATAASLPQTTFFTWDAIALDLSEGTFTALEGYFDQLRSGIVDLNLADNPNPIGATVRTLRVLEGGHARLGSRLWKYLLSQLQGREPDELAERSGDRRSLVSKAEWIRLVRLNLERHATASPEAPFGLLGSPASSVPITQLEFETMTDAHSSA